MVTNSNGFSKKRQQTARRIIQALRETNGLKAAAAKRAGISLMTISNYVRDFPTVKEAVSEQKERNLDFAEGKLYEKIQSGNLTAIIFYLKTQGKGRGYIERIESDAFMSGKVEHEHTVKFEVADIRDALQSLVDCKALSISTN